MAETTPRSGSLVLYKNRPARVAAAGRKKLDLELEDGGSQSVRYKDVDLLHPGPLESLADLKRPDGEIKIAWELLAGSTTTLSQLAELAYAAYTPSTAWAAWEWVADGLYFQGTPGEVVASRPGEVAEEQAARAAKAAEEQAWAAFLERMKRDEYAPEDEDFLRDVEELALERREQSRTLRELGRAQTPENAHALLLKVGYWDETVNVYPIRLGLPTAPPDVSLPALPDEERVDLTHLPAFAIDDADSRDPDDAISLDGERLWVHVADVAALIPPGSPADEEARARGANLYLPEGTVPMLPPEATPRLALGLAEISPALSFGIDFDESGDVLDLEVVPSRIRVTRLSYAEADARLAEEPLRSLYRFARRFYEQRHANGAISIELPEVKVRVVDGEVIIEPLPNLRSRTLVREAMLAAGESVARFAQRNDIIIPFATQDPPDLDRLSPDAPTAGPAGQFALRRTFTRSQAATVPGPHAGLGLSFYAQATSPLRRYLDLVVHQQLRAYLRGAPLMDEQAIVERIGATDAVTGNVRYAERLANEHWTLVYLLRHSEWEGEGVLVETSGRSGKFLIPELGLEPRVYFRRDLALNRTATLAVNEVDLPELQAHFRIVD